MYAATPSLFTVGSGAQTHVLINASTLLAHLSTTANNLQCLRGPAGRHTGKMQTYSVSCTERLSGSHAPISCSVMPMPSFSSFSPWETLRPPSVIHKQRCPLYDSCSFPRTVLFSHFIFPETSTWVVAFPSMNISTPPYETFLSWGLSP